MSKYRIYRIDNPDPARVGKRRRRSNILVGILSGSLFFIYIAVREVFNINFPMLYPITILIVLAITLYFQLKFKSENRKIITIGDIEFTRTSIIKHIADSVTEFSYESLNSIELTKHIPALNASESKSGFYTYILSLNFKDAHSEKLVVSDKPSEKGIYLSITETVKTLKKISAVEVVLN